MAKNYVNELSVVFGGEAGQGMDTIAVIISKVYKNCGYNVCFTKEYMSRIRGGTNTSEIRISQDKANSYTDRIDFLFALSPGTIDHLENRITEDTFIFINPRYKPSKENLRGKRIIEVNFSEISKEIGSRIYENALASGILFGLSGIDIVVCGEVFKKSLAGKSEEIIDNNITALGRGYKIGQKLDKQEDIKIKMTASEEIKDQIILTGTEAVAMGCLAGGCNFVSSYPMTPATGVFIKLCGVADDFGIITEQAEDEISAMNMGIAAWYAGARAMVSTSGGGFDLMTEGLSLAGITESPMVIHLGQRPGPATGVPTKTEQGDLPIALHAGHGEFPRIIYAPGDPEESYELAKLAFMNADRYQVPVFILTDTYLLDRSYNIPAIKDIPDIIEQCIVKTEKDYKRYKFTESGISPRGIPGYGEGLVCVDGDEHDEQGHITEDLSLRVKMVDKRRKKLGLAVQDSIPPELIGNSDYKTLLIGWGSTKNSIIEAIRLCDRDDIALLHFKQVYPLSPDAKDYMERAEKLVAIENNTEATFARLLRAEFCIDTNKNILRYDGTPFSPEKLAKELKNL